VNRVAVSGALANRPGNGGGAAVRATWVEALRRLGFEVWFVEQIERRFLHESGAGSPGRERPLHQDPVRFFEHVTAGCGLAGRAALLDERGEVVAGPPRAEVEQLAEDSALLVSLGGHLRLPSLLSRFRRRVYVDLDPGYTQLWQAGGSGASNLDGHHCHYTVGLGVGRPGCAIPTGGIRWRPLPPPVVLDEWTPLAGGLEAFTTVAAWRGAFGRVEHAGGRYGLKAHEMRKLIALPARMPAPLEIALDIHPADRADLDALRAHGWRVVDPRRRVPDPEAYRAYVRASGAELSAAQGIYVETGSGWLSDRTVRYLAAGRPALVQDTGIARHLPVGEGLLVFGSPDEAVAGAAAIAADYERHRRRARQLAEEHFDSDRVVGGLLEEVGVSP
jgi:hypothetical protein